jgi:hypothetical protein
MALLKSEQITRLIVRHAVDPAAVEDADPLEGESAESGLVSSQLHTDPDPDGARTGD